jgi:hypothetical protein
MRRMNFVYQVKQLQSVDWRVNYSTTIVYILMVFGIYISETGISETGFEDLCKYGVKQQY